MVQQRHLANAHQLSLMSQYMVQQEMDRQQAGTREKQKKAAPYTRFQVAKLLGSAGLGRYKDLPSIWNKFLESTDHDDHRVMLMTHMAAWYQHKGCNMPKGLYFTKERIRQIRSTKFLPGGAIGLLETAGQGVSNMIFLPRSISAIQSIERYKSQVEKAKANLTLKEIWRKDKGIQRQPVAEFGTADTS